MHYFLRRFQKHLCVAVLISAMLAGCYQYRVSVLEVNPEVTPTHFITQNVKLVENPLSQNRLNCAVAAHVTKEYGAWVKHEGADVEFINTIGRDQKGRMWLATDGHGLTLFDTQGWHNWQPETRSDMPKDAIRSMAVTENVIYAGAYGSSDGGDVMLYDIAQDKWNMLQHKDMRGNVIGGFAVDHRGRAFFVVLTKATDFITTTVTSGETYTPANRPTLLLDVYANGSWEYITMPEPPAMTIPLIKNAIFDTKGNYWLATGQFTGVWKFDGTSWTIFTANDGYLPSNQVNALAIDKDGRIWAATVNGLAVYDTDGTWYAFSKEKFPWFNGWLKNVAVDPENRVWIASNEALTVYNGQEVAVFKPSVVGESLWDEGIGFDQDGCVWVDALSLNLAVLRAPLTMTEGNFNFQQKP